MPLASQLPSEPGFSCVRHSLIVIDTVSFHPDHHVGYSQNHICSNEDEEDFWALNQRQSSF